MKFEGAVYSAYLHGDILKRKPFNNAEFECIAVKEGRGKRKRTCRKFILRLNDHQTFNCGAGNSYKVLRDLFQNPPIGKMITVRYQHTSEAALCAQFMPPVTMNKSIPNPDYVKCNSPMGFLWDDPDDRHSS